MTDALTVVIATKNRPRQLRNCILSVRDTTAQPVDFVVVGTRQDRASKMWCESQPDIDWTYEPRGTTGCIAAYNRGFRRVRAEVDLVGHLNDDCIVGPGALDEARQRLQEEPALVQVAIPFGPPGGIHRLDYILLSSGRWLCCNLGLTRRSAGDEAGWWGRRTTHYGGDAELSMQFHDRRWPVLGLRSPFYIDHLLAQDATRRPNTESETFYAHWRRWEPNRAAPRPW